MQNYTAPLRPAFVDHGTHMTFEHGLHRHDFKQYYNFMPHARWMYPFQWEREFDGGPYLQIFRENIGNLACLAGVYLFLIFAAPPFLKNRKLVDLKIPLCIWNFFLFSFSLMGAVRTVPHIFFILYDQGGHYMLCSDISYSYAYGAAGLWSLLFVFSKVFELGDTIFLILRRRPLILLHWFHHLSVVLLCWQAATNYASGGISFVATNYTIHTVMYFYYFLMALGVKPAWFHPAFITGIQILQLAGGVLLQMCQFYYKFIRGEGDNCHIKTSTLFICFFLTCFQLSLFVEFFHLRYQPSKWAIKKYKTYFHPTAGDCVGKAPIANGIKTD